MKKPRCLGHEPIVEDHGKLAFRETFEEPDGNITEWLLFGATKVPVIVFPLTGRGEVVVLKQLRYGANGTGYELPGGVVDDKGSYIHTVIKELSEEAGYTCLPGQVRPLHRRGIWFEPASLRTRYFPFIARNCTKSEPLKTREVGEHAVPTL